MQDVQLPFVDEHSTHIAAGADDVWSALVDTVIGTRGHVVAGRRMLADVARRAEH